MGIFYDDLRYALRMLRKHPAFTAVAVVTLALGIGANAAIFTLTDAVLLQSLPVKDPDQLAVISTYDPRESNINSSFSYPMYQDLRDKNEIFSGVLARGGTQMNVSHDGRSDRIRGELVSGNYFEVLGVRPWVGRLFTEDDDRTPGAHPVAVLSYGFWERRFGKDLGIVGKTILVNEHPLTVIGVTPPRFYGIELSSSPDLRVPLMMTPVFNPVPATRLQSRNHWWLTVMARRKDGVMFPQGQASLEVLYRQILLAEVEQLPADTSAFDREKFLSRKIQLKEGSQGFQSLQREMKTPLLFLFGATCIVLLILCANLANLVLARDAVRDQEIAVRLALGAGRLRLLRQWLTEALLLAGLGALAGVLVAAWVKSALVAFIPPDYRMSLDTPLGWRLMGFTTLSGYSQERTQNFYRDLLGGLRTIPGVQSASLSSDSPISGGWDELGLVIEGYQPREGERVNAQASLVSSDYFRSLGISLIAGREFNDQDGAGSPKVAVINEKMAQHFFGGANPIGKKIGTDQAPDTVIVGVVKDAQYLSLREPPMRHFYTPITQQPRLFDLTMHIKTAAEPAAFVDLVRGQVQKLDSRLPLYDVKTLATQIDESLTQERLVTWLCTAFGLLATLLAALGLYGVLAFSVAQRTREIGIRLALGAQASDVFKLIIGQGMILVSVGVAIGVAASLALTRFIANLLFGVTPTHATTFVAVSTGLALVALRYE